MKLKSFLRSLNDRLSIWAICRFHVPLPDLQQTDDPVPGRIYYYYGRWVKFVKKDKAVRDRIQRLHKNYPDMDILLNISYDQAVQISVETARNKTELETILPEIVCSDCALKQIGLPCKKLFINGNRDKDICFAYHYELIKNNK